MVRTVRAKGENHGVEQEQYHQAKIEIRNGVLHLVSQFTRLVGRSFRSKTQGGSRKIASGSTSPVRAELTIKDVK